MKYDLGRVLVERTMAMALEDMLTDSRRTVRRLVDLGLTLCRGPFEQLFFSACKGVLEDSDSAYYSAMERAVRELNRKTLLTMGINVGFEGCTRGAKKIREKEKTLGCTIPWAISLTAGAGALSQSRVQQVVSQALELGIHVFVLEDRELAQPELEDLLERNPTCAFFLETPPHRQWELERLGQYPNLMLLLRHPGEGARELAAQLWQTAMPCGVCVDYRHAGEVEGLLEQIRALSPLLVLLRGEQASPQTRKAVYEKVTGYRTEGTLPFLLMELESDLQAIDTVISSGSCRLCIDHQGRAVVEGRVAGSLEELSLTGILQAAAGNTPG